MTFLQYMAMRQHEHSPVGALARDIVYDRDRCPIHHYSRPCDYDEPDSLPSLVFYLEEHCACDDAMNAAARAWADYIKWRGLEADYTEECAA